MKTESFIDFIESYGEAHPPLRALTGSEDVAQWQSAFRADLESLRSPVPGRVPPEAEIVESVEEADHTRHLLRIPVSAVSTLVAYLLVPRGMSPGETRPGLVAVHGHQHHGIDSMCAVKGHDEGDYARRTYPLFAVQAGYPVIVPALWGWRGRDGHLDAVRDGADKCNQVQMVASMYGLNVVDLHIQDMQAALDVLGATAEVDGDRIGALGNSLGGRMTMWLAVFDDRVKACVPSGCMNVFRERSLKLSSCGLQYPYGLLRYGDVPEVLSLIAPRPMQLQVGEHDGLITPEDRDHIEATVRGAYKALGAEENFDYQRFGDGHVLLWDLAESFFRRHLG